MEGSVLQQELKHSELDTTFDVLSPKTKNKTDNGMYCFCNTLYSHLISRVLNFATFAIWEKSWNLILAKSKNP